MLINTEKTKLMLIASRQKRNSLIDSDLKITFNDIDLKISSNEFMWIKILSRIIIFGIYLKRYHRTFGYYRRFEHILMFNIDFCTIMHILIHILNIVVQYGEIRAISMHLKLKSCKEGLASLF